MTNAPDGAVPGSKESVNEAFANARDLRVGI